jgi:membrane protein implicated in regulation of membrane protease activity
MQILNQFSYVFVSLFLLMGGVVAAAVWFPGTIGLLIVLFILLVLLAIGAVLRFQDTNDAGTIVPDTLIGKGVPVLLALYSNF